MPKVKRCNAVFKKHYLLLWKKKLGGKKKLPIVNDHNNGKRYVKLPDGSLAQLVIM